MAIKRVNNYNIAKPHFQQRIRNKSFISSSWPFFFWIYFECKKIALKSLCIKMSNNVNCLLIFFSFAVSREIIWTTYSLEVHAKQLWRRDWIVSLITTTIIYQCLQDLGCYDDPAKKNLYTPNQQTHWFSLNFFHAILHCSIFKCQRRNIMSLFRGS